MARTVAVHPRTGASYPRKVLKFGIDPHFAFANLLCDVAYSRAHGKAVVVLEDVSGGGDELWPRPDV